MDQSQQQSNILFVPCEFEAGKKKGKRNGQNMKGKSMKPKSKKGDESFCFECQAITPDLNSIIKGNIRTSQCECGKKKNTFINV